MPQSHALDIYPNPASDNATIKYTLNKDVSNVAISLYDITGRKIFTQNLGMRSGENIEPIQCDILKNGLYIIM